MVGYLLVLDIDENMDTSSLARSVITQGIESIIYVRVNKKSPAVAKVGSTVLVVSDLKGHARSMIFYVI